MEQHEGNGHEPLQGAKFNLEDLQKEDGIIPRMILSQDRSHSGVLHKAMSSITKNEDYRQELKTGYFASDRKQMQMVLALDELRECGIDETLVVDLLIAQKAGIKGGLIHAIFEALTHTTLHTNYQGRQGNRWWNRGESRSGTNSPIS
ncbi:MAG: hypothetical protein HWN68_17255 [Desulfobacterales bacterium]|nr:hypothetical protein [Desulfobacterales bacterium]